MSKFVWLALMVSAPNAVAMDFVRVSAGYRLREGPSTTSKHLRTLRDSVEATVLRRQANWVKLCLGGIGTVCEGGTQAWIYKAAVSASEEVPPPKRTACVGGSCARKPRQRIPEAVEPLVRAIGKNTDYTLPRDFHRQCATFISANGLGEWGKAVVSAAQRVAPDCFYNRNFYGSICPNYQNLPTEKKNAMIAMTFAAIAQTEAHCRPHARNPNGSNDIADGMFQLEYTAAFRAKQGRDPRWCKTRENIDTQGMQFQVECAVSTIDRSICKKWGSYLFDSRGYWQELRHDREITRRIRRTARSMRLCVNAVGGSSNDDDD